METGDLTAAAWAAARRPLSGDSHRVGRRLRGPSNGGWDAARGGRRRRGAASAGAAGGGCLDVGRPAPAFPAPTGASGLRSARAAGAPARAERTELPSRSVLAYRAARADTPGQCVPYTLRRRPAVCLSRPSTIFPFCLFLCPTVKA